MKKLNNVIALTTLFSLTSCVVPETATNIASNLEIDSAQKIAVKNKGANGPENFDPINSKYTQRDFAGCIGAILVSPLVLTVEAIINSLSSRTEVDINFSKDLIELVNKDLNNYIEKAGKISPSDFWNVLSVDSNNKLTLELINAYSKMSDESFKTRKQMAAYAFLYYLEAGTPKTDYKFTFDDRENPGEYFREYISFDGSGEVKNATDVGVCGYFRFSEINVESNNISENIESKISCINKFGTSASIIETYDKKLIVDIKGKISRRTEVDLLEVDIDDDTETLEYEYQKGFFTYPKIYVEIEKRSQWNTEEKEREYISNSAVKANIKVKYGYVKNHDTLKNMKCRRLK